MVIDVEKFKQDISEISGIPICNDIYTFFYDETSNCRKFSLSEKGFNSQSAVENNFILAGILFPGTEFDVNFDVLYSSLGYSEEQRELKFKHLYHNSTDFLAFIGSKRARAYLSWLSDSGLYVHYSTLNNLYYSLVDIIDSLWELYPQIVCDPMLCNEIKSAFYDFSVQYSAEITQILIDYEYPNVQDCNGFCDELCDFIRSFNNEDSCYPGFFLEMLRQMLKQAGKQGKLIFVQDNAPNKLKLNDFVIRSALDKKIIVAEGINEIVKQQKAIGRNLNQIATLANMNRLTAVNFQLLLNEHTNATTMIGELLRAVK